MIVAHLQEPPNFFLTLNLSLLISGYELFDHGFSVCQKLRPCKEECGHFQENADECRPIHPKISTQSHFGPNFIQELGNLDLKIMLGWPTQQRTLNTS